MFWMPKASIKHDGRLWVAKSTQDLAFETGLTERQVEDAVSRLRRLGLISTAQHLFQNKNVRHVLVTAKASASLAHAGAYTPVQTGDPTPVQTGDPTPVQTGTHIQGDTTGSYYMENSEPPLAGTSEAQGDVLMAGKDAKGKTIHELMMSSPRKDGKPTIAAKAKGVMALSQLWKSTVSEVYEQFVPSHTQKQLGQLKNFAAKCPSRKADVVLEWALRNWIMFVKSVETATGLKSTPAEPRIEFLLLHAGIAVNMALPSSQPAMTKQEAPAVAKKPSKPVQLISPTPAPVDQPKSLAELMAILNDTGED